MHKLCIKLYIETLRPLGVNPFIDDKVEEGNEENKR